MLKITIHSTNDATTIGLEGRLTGPWVEELDSVWQRVRASAASPLIVDLTGVTFIEREGKALLTRLWQEGAELLAAGCCNKSIVDEITGSGQDQSSHRGSARSS
ncbi:STAS domain-containing protein [Petrachloros mirabilis]